MLVFFSLFFLHLSLRALSNLTSSGVILLILIVVLFTCLVKLMKRRRFQHTPKVDVNDVYGTYDVTGAQSDYSTVQDSNDYYG